MQKTADEWMHRDELLFQSVHQTSEIWLKLAWNEVEEAGRLVAAGELAAAIRLLRRANDCLKLVTSTLDMLEHMSPWEYTEVRKVLGHGSGFDSPGFKELRRVAKPLGEAFHAARERAGLTLVEVYTRGREFEDLYTAGRAADRGRRAHHRLAGPSLQGRAARDRRRRDRHAGHARRGDGPPDPPLVLSRALGRPERPHQNEPARVSFQGIALGCGNFGGDRLVARRSSGRALARTTRSRSWTAPGRTASAGSTPRTPTAAAAARR